jgi:Cdc6-like AAA superfamily ATPase
VLSVQVNVVFDIPIVEVEEQVHDDSNSSHLTNTLKKRVDIAKELLSLGNVTAEILGRDNECKYIYEFLEKQFTKRRGNAFYAVGLCGCGKTSVVNKAIANFMSINKDNNIENYNFNGWMTKPFQVIANKLKLWKNTKERWTEKIARQSCSDFFKKMKFYTKDKDEKFYILFIDNFDQLPSLAISTLHDIAIHFSSRLILIAVSTNLSVLKDNGIPKHEPRVAFHCLGDDVLKNIILSRSNGLIHDDAASLISKMVAARHESDIRRALEFSYLLIKTAMQTEENKSRSNEDYELPVVTFSHAKQICNDIFESF